MSKQAPSSGILCNRSEVQIVHRRLRIFVKRGARAFQGGIGGPGGSVPTHTDAVDVEVPIAHREL